MVPMPRTRAMSQTAFTGVIWPVMLIWCEMRMRRVGTYAEFALCTTEQVHPLPANGSFGQGAAMGTPYATAYRAGGWSGKQDVAAGDRQRISASRSGRGTSSRHGAGSVGENRASAKEVGRKNEEGGIRKEELKMGRKTKNCVSPASTALDHYLASDLPTPNATAWQAT